MLGCTIGSLIKERTVPFNVEEFKAHIETDEGKDWFTTFVSTMGWKTIEEVEQAKEGVAKKNKEILQANKELKVKMEETTDVVSFVEKLKEIAEDYELKLVDDSGNLDYTGIETVLAKVSDDGEGDMNPTELQEVQKQLKASLREVEKAKKVVEGKNTEISFRDGQLTRDQGEIARLLIDGAFDSALRDHEYNGFVVSNILPALRAKSKAEISFEETSGRYSSTTDDGKSIKDWVDWWSETDEGKALRMAPTNVGGGSPGSSVGPGFPGKAWKDLSVTDKTDLYKKNPELYRKLRDKK